MADFDEESEGENNGSKITVSRSLLRGVLNILIGVAGIVVILLVMIFLGYSVINFLSMTGQPKFDCYPKGEVYEEHYSYVNITWLESDEIREYKDIPEEVRRNLSEDAKRYLRDSAEVDYAAREYQNLSGKEKSVFITAIETDGQIDAETGPDGEVYLSAYTNLKRNHTIYNGTVYECRTIDPASRGA